MSEATGDGVERKVDTLAPSRPSEGILSRSRKASSSPGHGFHSIPSDWKSIHTPSRQPIKKNREGVVKEMLVDITTKDQMKMDSKVMAGKEPLADIEPLLVLEGALNMQVPVA